MVVLVILLLFFSTSHALFLPLNSSTLPHFLNPDPPPPLPSPSPSSNSILKQVLKAIADKESWDPNEEVRVSEVDPTRVRVGRSQRYEFHVRVGRTVLVLRFSDGDVPWRKLGRDWAGFWPDFLEFGGGFGENPKPDVGAFELEGPLDLRVVGEDDKMSLLLPAMNVTHRGLRRTRIGDGIKIKVEGAQEVTLVHPHDISLLLNKSLVKHNHFSPFSLPSCVPLPSVRVVGSASLVAFRTHNSEAYIKTEFHSDDTIELLSEKCFNHRQFRQIPLWSFEALSSKVRLLEKVLWYVLGNSIVQAVPVRILKAKLTSLSLVKFRLEVERDITENDRIWKRVEAWRTKPLVERIWFEIVVRFDGEKRWNHVLVRKLTRPIISVESSPWSNLMSNISFTQFPSIVFPPDGLTLDVKW